MTTMTFDFTMFESLHRTEAWKYTNVSALAKIDFAHTPSTYDFSKDQLREFDIAPTNPLIVVVNGRVNEELSRMQDGIAINTDHDLANTVSSRGDSAIPTSDGECDSITITGTFDQTIHILQIITGDEPIVCSGRVFIYADVGCSVSVAETHVAFGEASHLFMPCTEIIANRHSNVSLIRSIRGSKHAYHLGSLHVCQHDHSEVLTHTVTLGGKLTRNEVYAYLDGEYCESNFDGMYMLGEGQHVDNHLRVEHNEPHGNSREFYKGVLDGNAKSVFTGRIYVKQDAQQTDAKQTNQNILLNDNAEATARPQLEIYADDVKCTHGATTGEIDDEAMLYLRSRGISAEVAKTLLIYAFLNESLQELTDDEFRGAIVADMLSNLPGGEYIRNL
jgi:Fe-S cluster assembly protein SufD